MKITIKTTNIDLTQDIKNYVNEKIGGVSKFVEGVIEVFVEVGRTTYHHQSGRIFRAEVNMRLPDKVLRVEAERKDLKLAIDEVKDKLQRQIKKYKRGRKARSLRGFRVLKKFLSVTPSARRPEEKDISRRDEEEGN